MKNIALLGFGTVGKGCAEILKKREKEITTLLGEKIQIKKILVRNKTKDRGEDYSPLLADDFNEILNDPEIQIVVEVTGDLEKGYKYISESLRAGKNIVTANKSVISAHFEELTALALKENKALVYEAAVGGGIPILKPLREECILNEITEVEGILNGTCNYILTRMFNEEIDYREVLKVAQELGYAEADPKDDVEGYDTMRKLRILASLAFKTSIKEENIELNGISQIQKCDVDYIKYLKSTVKLIARGKLLNDGFTAIVEPTIINKSDYFSNINMSFNSVAFKGDNVGDLKFYGPGAGMFPTADAVIRDILDVFLGNTTQYVNSFKSNDIKNLNESEKGSYYLRTTEFNAEEIVKILKPSEYTVGKENSFFLFEDINRKNLYDFCKTLIHDKDKYFIAKIGY